MGLSETEEQPREAKEAKREGRRKTSMCAEARTKRSQHGVERGNAEHLFFLHCFMLRLLRNKRESSFSPDCHDTVADKSQPVCSTGRIWNGG